MSWLGRGTIRMFECRVGVIQRRGKSSGFGTGDGATEVRGRCGKLIRVALLNPKASEHLQPPFACGLLILRAG